jgi:hypothetical protein
MISKLRFRHLIGTCAFFLCLGACSQKEVMKPVEKPRIVITADPELDDLNSLIRFILYSTDVKVEGLIYASSQFHWKGDGKGTKWSVPGREYTRGGLKICPCESWRWAKDERFIHDVVEAYEKAYPNLKVHNPAYPSPDELKSKIKFGNIEFDGDISKDSEGSNWIKQLILDNQPGKLFLTAWGGQSTIARALKSIEEEYQSKPEWNSIKEKVLNKVVILPSGDQDDTYRDYIKPNWPGIDYRQFSGGPRYSYGAQLGASKTDSIYLTPDYLKANVSDRGALGALYRVWGDGKQMVKDDRFDYFGLSGYTNEQLKEMGYIVWMPVQQKGSWLGEGDTGTFMNMLANGLRGYEDPAYGGWGGKQVKSTGVDFFQMDSTTRDSVMTAMRAQSRAENAPESNVAFFPPAMNDFVNRLHWAVSPNFDDANHEPKVYVKGSLDIKAKVGEQVKLQGSADDPDKNEVSIKWWQYPAGTYNGNVSISGADTKEATITIPDNAKPGETIHIILQGTDNGKPALTRYQRVVITVE